MTEISVTYKDSMGDDLAVCNAARVSFAKESFWLDTYVSDNTTETHKKLGLGDRNLIRFLALHDHWTPFGHVQIKVHVKAPIFVARQAVKHQVGLVWNEVSRRYVDDLPEFYFPDGWRKRAANKKQGSMENEFVTKLEEPMCYLSEDNNEQYGWGVELTDDLNLLVKESVQENLELYERMIGSDVAPELARILLPQNMMTEWIWTGSLMAFARIFDLRSKTDAQKEIRDLAEPLGKAVSGVAPVAWHFLTNRNRIQYLQQRIAFMDEFGISGKKYSESTEELESLYDFQVK